MGGGKAGIRMLVRGNAVDGTPIARTLRDAPGQRICVQLRDVGERASGEEVPFYEPHQALDLPLGKRVARLAEPGLEADAGHEGGVIGLPDGASLKVAADDDAFHVVGQDVVGHTHQHEGMNHADKQVFLTGIGEEFDVTGATVMAYHREAGNLIGTVIITSKSVHRSKFHRHPLRGYRYIITLYRYTTTY